MMSKTFYSKLTTCLLATMLSVGALTAQVSNYTFSSAAGTYTPLSGGTVIATSTATTGANALDDVTYGGVRLPFGFLFNGAFYDTISINTNGFVIFGNTTNSTTLPISATTVYAGAASAFGRDLRGIFAFTGNRTLGDTFVVAASSTHGAFVGKTISGTGIPTGTTITRVNADSVFLSAALTSTGTATTFTVLSGEIRTAVSGTFPNRVFTVQWSGFQNFGASNSYVECQIKLFETSYVIQSVYGKFTAITATTNGQVGLRGAANTDYVNRTTTTDWAATTAGATNTAGMTFSSTVFPALGLTYSWTPAACTGPVPPTAVAAASVVCQGNPVSLSLTNLSGLGGGSMLQWQISPDSLAWTDITGANASALTTTQTATNFYRVKLTCGIDTFSNGVKVTNNPNLLNGAYTINKTQPTAGTNFNSFADVVTALQCGISGPVSFNVVAGTGPYTEQFSLPATINGASTINRITFNGNGDTLQFEAVAANNYVIRLDGTDNITIKNFYIRNTSTSTGIGIFLTNLAENDSILNNTIDLKTVTSTTTASGCIVASGSQTNVTTDASSLSNCAIIGNTTIAGYTGIYINGLSTAAPSAGNVIVNNVVRDFYIYGIYSDNATGILIKGNDVSRANPNAFTTFYGIYVAGLSNNAVVDANRIYNPTTGNLANTNAIYGIYAAGDATNLEKALVSNNVIYNFQSATSAQYGIYNSGSDHYRYYHNSVTLDDAASTAGLTYAFFQITTALGIELQNNVFAISRGGTGTKRCVNFASSGTLFLSNHNAFYMGSTTGTTNDVFFFSSAYTTLAAWQASNLNQFDQQSVEVNPQFVSASTGDLTPINPSLNNAGNDTLGITVDFTGATRGTVPDIGAFEFTPVPTDAGITAVNNPGAVANIGVDTLKVSIGNFGTSPITTVTVYYTLNGVLQPSFTYSDTIPSAGNSGPVVVSPITLVNGTNTIVVWTSNPNGTPDATNNNDTITYTLTACAPLAGTYTINKTLPTGGTNYNSFTDAANALLCGIASPVTFDVVAGTGPYTEQFSVSPVNGASAANRVTFNGNGETIQFTPVAANNYVISLDGADYITIKNFRVVNTATATGVGILMTNLAEFDSILNNTVDLSAITTSNTASGCIVATGSPTNVTTNANSMSNCAVIGNTTLGGYAGIILNGQSATVQSPNNTIANNTVQNFFIYGILTDHVRNTSFLNNDVSRANANVYSTAFYGIYLSGSASSCLVNGNSIHDSHTGNPASTGIAYPIYTSGSGTDSTRNTVSNNIVYNINSATATQYGIYNTGGSFYNYYHNTVVLNNAASTSGTTHAFYQTTVANGIRLQNNVFVVSRGGTGEKTTVRFNTNTTTFVSNNNVVFNGSPAATTKNLFFYNTVGYQTLALWQASNANAFDQQSVEANPNFVSVASGNLAPTNAAVNNTGIDTLGITTDITGATRGALPDAGAFEFSPSSNDIAAQSVSLPFLSGCFKANEVVRVSVSNSGTAAQDFAVDSLVINVVASGAGNSTVDTVIKTGVLQPDSTLTVDLFAGLNVSALGNYTIRLTAKRNGDQLALNDTVELNLLNPLAAAIPDSVNFTGFTGTNLTTVFPLWRESTGATAPTGTTSSWTSQTGLGGASNVTARINLFGSSKRDWIVGPKFVPGATDVLTFDAAVTNWNSTTVADAMGSDDSVNVMVSVDCGLSWQKIFSIDASFNMQPVLRNFSLPLAAYAGQQVIFAFMASEGNIDDTEDYDFHLDNIFIKTPPAKELAMQTVNTPALQGCYGANEQVQVTIANTGSQPFNFATDSAVITVQVTGAVTQTLTNTVNTGTLNNGATLNVTVGTLNMTTPGTYNFVAILKGNGDDVATNDTTRTSRIQAPVASIPDSVSFTGFTGANLATVFPQWREGSGANAPNGTTSNWLSQTGVGGTSNITARVNLLGTSRNEWIVGPKFIPSATDYISFDAATTSAASTGGSVVMGSDDKVQLMISTDCGATWQAAFTIDSANAPSSLLTKYFVSLASFAGQPTIVAFKATDGPVDDPQSYDFHLDNIYIGTPVLADAKMELFVTPVSGCGSDSTEVRVTVGNNGLAPIANLQVNASITGASTSTLSNTVTDTLQPGEKATITVGYFNSANGGTFNIKAFTSLPNDERSENDTLVRTVNLDSILFAPQIADTAICIGSSIDLVIPTQLEVEWYNAAGDSFLAVGNVLNVTPNTTTTYRYRTTQIPTTNYNVGYTVAPTSDFISSTIDYGIRFNANSDFILKSVVMYPTGTGTITFAVKDDATEAVLYTSQAIPVSDGGVPRSAVTVPVNLFIPAGQNYRLTMLSYTGITNLGRASSGVTGFPFATPNNEVVLTNSSLGTPGGTATTSYYWFYDWNVAIGALFCPSPLKYVTVNVSDYPVVDTFIVTDAKCFGQSSGAIDIAISGGALPYTHSWSNGASTEDLSLIAAGTYTDTVRTAAGCAVISQVIVVNEPSTAVTASVQTTDVNCFGGANGSATVNATGGTPTYTYEWSNDSITASISSLLPGVYTVTVTDLNGCSTIENDTVTEPVALIASSVSTDQLGTTNGSIDVTVSGGTPGYTFGWTNNASSEDITAPAGIYTVTITDANGCTFVLTDTIDFISNIGAVETNIRKLTLYPNPTSDVAFVSVELSNAADVVIGVYDVNGRLLADASSDSVSIETIQLDLSALAAGVYTVRVTLSGETYTRQLVIQR